MKRMLAACLLGMALAAGAAGEQAAWLPGLDRIACPEEQTMLDEGAFADGRAWQRREFWDASENLVRGAQPGPRKLVCAEDGEMFLLFARAANGDEIYRWVRRESGEDGEGLRYDGGTSASVGLTALRSMGGRCTGPEADPVQFLYWDESRGRFLSAEEWRISVHYAERLALNDEDTLPLSAAQALEAGFEQMPRADAAYHQLNKSLSEYAPGACLKFAHENGREAIYVVIAENGDPGLIAADPAATRLLLRADYPEQYADAMPTYNYCPVGPTSGGAGALAGRMTIEAIGHFYFDMLPYYWWGNEE